METDARFYVKESYTRPSGQSYSDPSSELAPPISPQRSLNQRVDMVRNIGMLSPRLKQPEKRQNLAVEKPNDEADLQAFVTYFDYQWKQEGLPSDWYNLGKKVGFSMNTQMDRLRSTRREEVAKWHEETDYMVRGFALEYLSPHLVYPCRYVRDPEDPNRMYDPNFGKQDMVDIVSEEEREGAVKQSMRDLKKFFQEEGDLAIMTSPKGPTGLKTDKGKLITYPDSYFFILERDPETGAVTNFTIKTDFDVEHCREVVRRLTGKELPLSASLGDFSREIAYIKDKEKSNIGGVKDVVKILQDVGAKAGMSKAWGEVDWDDVFRDIDNIDKLYVFSEKANKIFADFKSYCDLDGQTSLKLRKGLAATILRISKLLLYDEAPGHQEEIEMRQGVLYQPDLKKQVMFGQVLERVAAIPGCAGGGEDGFGVKTVGGSRRGRAGGGTEEGCKVCGKDDSDDHYHCPPGERNSEYQTGCGRRFSSERKRLSYTKECLCGFKFGC